MFFFFCILTLSSIQLGHFRMYQRCTNKKKKSSYRFSCALPRQKTGRGDSPLFLTAYLMIRHVRAKHCRNQGAASTECVHIYAKAPFPVIGLLLTVRADSSFTSSNTSNIHTQPVFPSTRHIKSAHACYCDGGPVNKYQTACSRLEMRA